MIRSKRNRRGFSLIELLVVVMIVFTLIAMLLPAMLHARAAAKRVQCQNNLKQVGLALHMYHSVNGSFPPGYLYRPGPEQQTNAAGFGWGSMILPYSDQTALYNTIVWDVPAWQEENASARATQISSYMCSTDSSNTDGEIVLTRTGYASSNFAASFGPTDMKEDPEANLGAFGRNSATTQRGVTDGLAQTIFIGERWNGTYEERGQGSRALVETTWFGTAPEIDSSRDSSHLVMFQAIHKPNAEDSDQFDASSAHEGGVHYLMGDGSVHFISFKIETQLYQKLTTIRGGEMLGEF